MTVLESQKFLRSSFLEALARLSPADFTPVAKFEQIVNDAYFESRRWMHFLFGTSHDPHEDALQAKHSYYIWPGGPPGFDLLRHEYNLGTRKIVVTESVGLIHVAIHMQRMDEANSLDPADRASKVAGWLLALRGKIRFVQDPSEALLVSSTDKLGEPVERWSDRIYARSSDSLVELLIHKEDPMLRSRPRNYSIWFDSEFRTHPPKAVAP